MPDPNAPALFPPFNIGDRVRWTLLASRAIGHDRARTYTIATITDLGDQWRIHATGNKRSRYITSTWFKNSPPRIELA